MAKLPGQVIEPRDSDSITLDAGASLAAGDAVGVSGAGTVAPTDDTNETDEIGVVSDRGGEAASGESTSIEVERGAVVVVNVASGTAAGKLVGASATEGQLAAGTATGPDDFGITLSAEGGSYKGSIPTGYAAVLIL